MPENGCKLLSRKHLHLFTRIAAQPERPFRPRMAWQYHGFGPTPCEVRTSKIANQQSALDIRAGTAPHWHAGKCTSHAQQLLRSLGSSLNSTQEVRKAQGTQAPDVPGFSREGQALVPSSQLARRSRTNQIVLENRSTRPHRASSPRRKLRVHTGDIAQGCETCEARTMPAASILRDNAPAGGSRPNTPQERSSPPRSSQALRGSWGVSQPCRQV